MIFALFYFYDTNYCYEVIVHDLEKKTNYE